LTPGADGAAIASRRPTNATATIVRLGAIMTVSSEPNPLHTVADRIDAVAAHARQLAAGGDPPTPRQLVDLAAATASISLTLLEAALPTADDDQPGVGEAFERAAELTTDGQRHLITAFHLLAGAHGIATARPRTT